MNAIVSTILSVSLCLGVAVAGAYAADAMDAAKETAPRDSMNKTAMPAGTMSRTAPSSVMGKESMPPRALTGGAMTRDVPQDDAGNKDAMKKAAPAR